MQPTPPILPALPSKIAPAERRTGTGMTVVGVPVAPSVQTVLGTLHAHEPMTSADIQATTGLPRRTVYAALRTLRGLGVLMERPSLRDMRQSYVWLAAEAVQAPQPAAAAAQVSQVAAPHLAHGVHDEDPALVQVR